MIDQQAVVRRLAKLFSDTQGNDVVPGTRGTLVPAAQYDDGKYHLAWPGLLAAPIEGFNRMWDRGDDANISNPEALAQNSADSFDAAGGAMTGGLAAGALGAAERRLGQVAGDDMAGAGAVNPAEHLDYIRDVIMKLPQVEQPPAAAGQPFSARLFNGSARSYTPEQRAKHSEFWATNSPAEAATYAPPYADGQITPVDVSFKNPLILDAKGANWDDVPVGLKGGGEARMTTDHIHRSALAYHPDADGLVFQNVIENGHLPSTSVVALKRGTVRSALTGDLLYANSHTGSAVPLAMAAAEKPKGFTAYHGSPHDFDKFSLDKIGTGEGAQAYGHGLYFAENEGVAKSYRDSLSGLSANATYGGQPWDYSNPQHIAANKVETWGGRDQAIADIRQAIPGMPDDYHLKQKYAEALSILERGDDLLPKGQGHMYEVNIKADPEQFLDWDAPLGQQSEAVRQALQSPAIQERISGSYRVEPNGDRWNVIEPGGSSSWTSEAEARRWMATRVGKGLHPNVNAGVLARYTGDPAAMTAAMREAGIPGIRYLDQASRGAGEGSRNYVLFDDNLVDITRKYANHPFGSAVPLAFSDYEEETPTRKLARQFMGSH